MTIECERCGKPAENPTPSCAYVEGAVDGNVVLCLECLELAFSPGTAFFDPKTWKANQ